LKTTTDLEEHLRGQLPNPKNIHWGEVY